MPKIVGDDGSLVPKDIARQSPTELKLVEVIWTV